MDIFNTLSELIGLNEIRQLLILSNLAETLKSEGPYTLFAPIDEIFPYIPQDLIRSLKSDPDRLRGILLYHIAPGELSSLALTELKQIDTLNGECLTILMEDNNILLDNAKIINLKKDIVCENGIIHCVDRLLIP